MCCVNRIRRLFGSLTCVLMSVGAAQAQTTYYVDDDGTPGNGCTSWEDACPNLKVALVDLAISGDEIWVAVGTYKPDRGTGNRSGTFPMKNGVSLYGGFDGTETTLEERAGLFDQTILIGDIGTVDDNSDNSYHVVTGSGTDATAVLDGFIITGGNADGDYPYDRGGGMYNDAGSPTVDNCTFSGNTANWGGGMYNLQYSSPVVTNCTFSGNSANGWGGGMYNQASRPMVTSCTFSENSAGVGGGMSNISSRPSVTNCRFSGNSAYFGGGMFSVSGSPTVTNCTFSGNSAAYGGGMYHGRCAVTNCILWGNVDHAGVGESAQIRGVSTVVSHSCIQGLDAFAGDGNIGNHPMFTDPDGADGIIGTVDDDLRLLPGSPCVDAGDNQAVPADAFDLDDDGDIFEHVPFDMDENSRFVDDPCVEDVGLPDPQYPALGIVDMGAYERPNDSMDDPDGDGFVNCADNCPVHFNPGQEDCDDDGVGNVCACALGVRQDCNENNVPDECDVDPTDPDGNGEVSQDADGNGRPDECQRRLFVDDDAPLGGDGRSWDTAYRFLQDGLAVAAAGDEVRVAGGTYRPDRDTAHPDGTGSRLTTFRLISDVAVRGGYAGRGAPNPDERNITLHEAILSGDLNGDDGSRFANYNDNSYHVTVTGTNRTGVLDGFTITAGNARDFAGGGMVNFDGSSPTIANCLFMANRARFGGGMDNIRASPTIVGCVFEGNLAEAGGAIWNQSSEPTILSSVFNENTATGMLGIGGAIENTSSNTTVADCVFVRNTSSSVGGAVHNEWSMGLMTNCVFIANSAFYGGTVFNHGSHPALISCTLAFNRATRYAGGLFNSVGSNPMLTNCILWGNTDRDGEGESAQITDDPFTRISTTIVNYSNVQGWTGALGGVGNIGDDPLFADAHGPDGIPGTGDDDLRLSTGSPCIDAGDNAALPPSVLTDLDGNPRFVNDPLVLDTGDPGAQGPPIVDMGAHERQVVLLDILPKRCPNRISVKSRRPVPVAIVGTDTFDVMQIDPDSLVLTRADGVGGSVRPVLRKPGRGITIKDVATPFNGDLCGCHKRHGDGIDDLVARFSMGDMADILQLDSASKGESVILTISGLLSDGSPFDASDCILITGRP